MTFSDLRDIDLAKKRLVTPRQSVLLEKLGIRSVSDLLLHLPFRYEDRTKIEPIAVGVSEKRSVTTIVRVVEHSSFFFNGKSHPKIAVEEDAESIEKVTGESFSGPVSRAFLVAFNRRGLKDHMKLGDHFWLSAEFSFKYNQLQSTSFDYERFSNDGKKPKSFDGIFPVYHLTEKLFQKELRRIVSRVLETYADQIEDEIPEYLKNQHHLLSKKEAIRQIHFPDSRRSSNDARIRLAFEELFKVQLVVHLKKSMTKQIQKPHRYLTEEVSKLYEKKLPYLLTGAQKRSLNEIFSDMKSTAPMHRLLQGDVGSGKTSVAILAMLFAAENGYQAVLMSPTEALCRQQGRILEKVSEITGLSVTGLFGSQNPAERGSALEKIQNGSAKLIYGTHALFQDEVHYHNLTLVIIDEQHKFGVKQRSRLTAKGNHPDLLVMTATPIPRTLTLSVYGDLAVSIIDELPAGRKEIISRWVKQKDYEKMLDFIQKEIENQRQAYFIYPLIEESDLIDSRPAVLMFEKLKKYFPTFQIGLIHGRMNAVEKDETMKAFAAGKIDILVSTTVIEVGIDVASASVIVIENAERFGLSQLHQLRGRVGRGNEQSYCFFVTPNQVSEETDFRLSTMVKTNNGFVIAEEDLKLRGPGEILGTRQSGILELKVADLIADEKLLFVAQRDAEVILKEDPNLSSEKNRPLHDGLLKSVPTEFLRSG